MADEKKKVAFVTGGSSGIGRAAAEAFVRRGYATVLADRDADLGRTVEAELRELGECLYVRCDVTDDDSVRQAVEKTVTAFGGLNAAFNAAGIDGEHGKSVADASLENWNRVLAIDLTGMFSCMRHEIPHMLDGGGGSIVNCSSVAGIRGTQTLSAYSAAKHGVIGLTKSAALEYGRAGLRINVVCPGTIDTPMFRRSMSPEIVDYLVGSSPVGRLAEASEIADVVVWLCDEAPGFLTGQEIVVDGAASSR